MVGVPGLGDDIQAIKPGILEIADIFVVNKADLDQSQRLVGDLRAMLQLRPGGLWDTPVLQTVATQDQGVAILANTIMRHQDHLSKTGTRRQRRAEGARRRIQAIVQDRFRECFERLVASAQWPQRFDAVAERGQDPYAAADDLFSEPVGSR